MVQLYQAVRNKYRVPQQRQTPDFDETVKHFPQITGARGAGLLDFLWWVTAPMLISLVDIE